MTDYLKVNSELQKALSAYRLFTQSPLLRLQREAQIIAKMQQEQLRATKSLSLAVGVMTKSLSIQPRLAAEMAAMQKALQSNLAVFAEVEKLSNINSLIRPFPISDVLQQMRVQVNLISSAYRDFGSRLRSVVLIPSTISAAHIASTVSLMGKWKEQFRAVDPLMTSISFTESQVSSQEADILDYPDVFDFSRLEEDESDITNFPTQNLYYVQRSELVLVAKKNPHFLDDEDALSTLPTMQYFNIAQSVCRLVTIINRQCAVSGNDVVFRLTNRLAESLIAIPNLVAVTQYEFAEFIDYLYFIVYEGAGKDNLRFIDLIDSEDSEPVWMLKHLRNYFTRHDVEHGRDSDIKKKHERLGQIFSTLIGKPLPRSRRDFGNAQLQFLQHIEAMLKKVSDELERRATAPQPVESQESN